MLPVGKLGKGFGAQRDSAFSEAEQKTMIRDPVSRLFRSQNGTMFMCRFPRDPAHEGQRALLSFTLQEIAAV